MKTDLSRKSKYLPKGSIKLKKQAYIAKVIDSALHDYVVQTLKSTQPKNRSVQEKVDMRAKEASNSRSKLDNKGYRWCSS